MHNLYAQLAVYTKAPPDSKMFALWRAVFSLCRVDGALAPEEMGFVTQVMDLFNFSEEQSRIVYADMVEGNAPMLKFQTIEDEAYKHQFFRLARILIWCDGVLHDAEVLVLERFKKDLGDQVQDYESELRWLDRKPDMPLGEDAPNAMDATEKMIVYQMLAFMKELEAESL